MPLMTPAKFPSQPAGNLFSGIDFTDPGKVSKLAGQQAGGLQARGQGLSATGMDALQPVLSRLMKLLSGDEGAISDATRPQTKGVIDQYDTARKAISQFSPKGGGRETALATSRFSEASDISTIKSNAITSASKELSSLGASLLGMGESEQAQSLSALMGLLENATTQQQNDRSFWGGLGEAIGGVAAMFIPGVGPAIGTALLGDSAKRF